jgi:hypothetical protein
MKITIFRDNRFGPAVWRAVLVHNKQHWCLTSTTRPTRSKVLKQWRSHGRTLFRIWDPKTQIFHNLKQGVL